MKKIIAVILSIFLFVSCCLTVCGANKKINFEDNSVVDTSTGDVNLDGKITSADARLCLRTAALLEMLTDKQKEAADVFGTGDIDASCARKILRVAAGLENMNIVVRIEPDKKVIVLPENGAQTTIWKCFYDESQGISVNMVYENNTIPGTVGRFYDQIFTVQTEKKGYYVLNFRQVTAWNDGEVHEEYCVILIVE